MLNHLIQGIITEEDLINLKDFYRNKHYVFLVELIIDKIKNGDIKIDGEKYVI